MPDYKAATHIDKILIKDVDPNPFKNEKVLTEADLVGTRLGYYGDDKFITVYSFLKGGKVSGLGRYKPDGWSVKKGRLT